MEAPVQLHAKCPATYRLDPGQRNGKRRRSLCDVPEPVRKSRRLQEKRSQEEISLTPCGIKQQYQLLSPSPSRTPKADSPHHSNTPPSIVTRDRKRKAELVVENSQLQSQISDEPHCKRLHTGNNIRSPSAGSVRIHHWIQNSHWPKRDFEPDPSMDRPVSKRSRSSSSQGQQSDSDTPVPSDGSDQRSRTQKSSPYAQPGYATLLAYKKGYMHDSDAGILASEKKDCRSLLNNKQSFPSGTLFDDRCFLEACANLQDENEMRVVIDLLRLIAPSAENLAAQGMKKLKCLKEHTNAGWNESIPVEGPRPQPDYSVGFRYSTFSDDQFNKLNGNFRPDAKKFFAATLEMFFPFLTAEVKCGKQALEIADRQNAHSMTVAIRGIVELFRKVGRAKELHRKVLGFSISLDQQQVRIYAHYPEIDDLSTKCYRHVLRSFIIIDDGGKERWTAYQFVRNVYDSFVPTHLERIKTAVDQLPDSALKSFELVLSAERGESSQEVISAPSSQEVTFKKPNPPNRGVAKELRAQLEQAKSNASMTESALQRQLDQAKQREDQLREEAKQEKELFMELLSKASSETAKMEERLRSEAKQREDKLMDMLGQRLG